MQHLQTYRQSESGIITSTAGLLYLGMISTGIPRPSSAIVTELSLWTITHTFLAKPARPLDRVVNDFVKQW